MVDFLRLASIDPPVRHNSGPFDVKFILGIYCIDPQTDSWLNMLIWSGFKTLIF